MHGLYFKIRLWVMEISFLEFERRFKMEMNRNMCILKWIHSISWCSFWLLSFCFFQIFSKISVFQSTVCVSVCVWIIQSSMTLCHPMDYSPPGSFAMGFSRQEYWISSIPFPIPIPFPFHFQFQGIFLTQELNPALPHCRQILYCLSHQVSDAN